MKDLKGKNAIVTGASRGLGVYIAKTLAARGANVAVVARSAAPLEETRRACEAAGVRAIAVSCDVSSVEEQRRLLATVERELGQVDILVNNAGIEVIAPLQEMSTSQIDRIITTNLNAPIWMTKLVLPAMRARRGGVIVNVASLAGKAGTGYAQIYSATKAGLVMFTEAMCAELDGTGVHIGVVCPTFVSESGMWAEKHSAAKAPAMTQAVTPQAVANAVLKVIEGKQEVLVTKGPFRPLLALSALTPGLSRRIVKRLGVTEMWRKEAERLQAGEDRPGARASSNGAGAVEPRETADVP